MKKTLQLFCSILSIVSLMIPAIPSMASEAPINFDPNTGYAFVSAYPHEDKRNCNRLFKFKYSHLHEGFSFMDIETGKYLSGDSYISGGKIRNLKDTECFFEILPCTEETIENEKIDRRHLYLMRGLVYLKEIGRNVPPKDVRYRIIPVNDPKADYGVPCDKHVKICAFDGKQILFLWANKKNKLDFLYESRDGNTLIIEPKKRYFSDAREDEYFLATYWNKCPFASGRIVKSKNFSNLNRVFTFIGKDGLEFEIIFDEMGGTYNQLRYPRTPGELDVSGFKDNEETFTVNQDSVKENNASLEDLSNSQEYDFINSGNLFDSNEEKFTTDQGQDSKNLPVLEYNPFDSCGIV